jgi:uncharacterized protein YgiM (DUF1202 family)
MKMNVWVLMMLSTSLLGQQATNTPSAPAAATPAPTATTNSTSAATAAATTTTTTTNAPAAKAPGTQSKKKTTPKKKSPPAAVAKKDPAAELRTVPLVPGPAVIDANHVNVRGQAKLKSEVITRLDKGAAVTVLQEIVNNNSGPSEPSAWAKIILPANAPAWVNTSFIDANNKTVVPKRLNVRGGPGENYSVLGRLEHGEPVKPLETKGEWTRIEAPTNATAFVAAQYLKQTGEPAALAALTPDSKTTNATPTAVADSPTIAAAPTEPPAAVPGTTTPSNTPPSESSSTTTPTTEPGAPVDSSVPAAPPPKRIVQREGIVRGTFSIQAPTHFELVSQETGRTIDYLYTSSPNLDLRRYKGLRIVVTGEESLEERWGNTPVITIQRIQVLE